jgi:hypothetical protein
MIISIVILVLILTALVKLPYYRVGEIHNFVMPVIFLFKVVCSSFVWWYFYTKPGYGTESDLYQFYNAANELQKKLPWIEELKVTFGLPVSKIYQSTIQNTPFWNKLYDYGFVNDNRIMIRLNLLLNWLVGNSFFSHSLLFLFLGFNGSFFFVQMIQRFKTVRLIPDVATLFLLPSTLIWTGGMFKESVLLFTLGGLISFFVKVYKHPKRMMDFFWLVIFAFLLLQTKPLYSILFLYTCICLILHSRLNFRRFEFSYLLIFFIPIALIVSLNSNNSKSMNDKLIKDGRQFHLAFMLKNKQEDFNYDVALFKPKTVIPISSIDGTYVSVLKSIPTSVKNIMLVPIILAFEKWEMIPFALEMLLLLALILLSFLFPSKDKTNLKHLFYSFVIPAILCFLFLGLTVPIAGLIVKYSSPIMPILFVFVSASIEWEKVKFTLKNKLVRSK